MNTPGTPHGTRSERVAERVENLSLARVSLSSELHNTTPNVTEPVVGPPETIIGKINRTDPRIGFAATLAMLRPDWRPDAIYAALTADPRPPVELVPAAVRAALDPTTHHPNRIAYTDTRKPAPEIRAPRCPHGTLADPDGRGTNCAGCGTTVRPPDPALLAQLRTAASGPTRHTPEEPA